MKYTKHCENLECNNEYLTKRVSQKYCCLKCSYCKNRNDKISKSKINKSPEQNKDIHDKYKKTMLARYGAEHNFHLQSSLDKRKSTYIDNYGVDSPMKSPSVLQRKCEKFKEKYGVDNPSQLDWVKEKKKDTLLKNYNVEYPYQSVEIKEKMIESKFIRFGIKNYDPENKKEYAKIVWQETKKHDLRKCYGYHLRGNAAKNPNAWHLDHIIPINYGFVHGIDPKLIGCRENLRFVPWRLNILKGDDIWTIDNYDSSQNRIAKYLLDMWFGSPKLVKI